VLNEIRRHGTLTRRELAKATGLAKSTIKEITDELVTSGFVEEVRDVNLDGRVGRPASSLRVSRASGRVVGVDIGADKILVGVARLDGHVISLERTVTHDLRGKAAILRATRGTVDKALKSSGANGALVLATVVGTPGVIDPRTGRVSLAPQIVGWEGIDLRGELELPLQGDIVIRRQADLSALAEVAMGAGRHVRNLLYVHIGIGIGGALVINSDLYGGNDGAAGEIGYLPLGFGDAPPPGSGFGTFEWSAGGSAFARAGSDAARGPSGKRLRELAGGDLAQVTAAAVFAAAAEGDPQGLAVATQMAGRLASGIAAAICVVNPEVAVISGGISLAGKMLLEMIRPRVSEIVPVMPKLVISSLGDESVVMGAVHHAVNVALDRLLAPA
jgi:glucokinase